MQHGSRTEYRIAASECLEIARTTTEPDTRERLTILASKFLDLANLPDSDSTLELLISEFNRAQMGT